MSDLTKEIFDYIAEQFNQLPDDIETRISETDYYGDYIYVFNARNPEIPAEVVIYLIQDENDKTNLTINKYGAKISKGRIKEEKQTYSSNGITDRELSNIFTVVNWVLEIL